MDKNKNQDVKRLKEELKSFKKESLRKDETINHLQSLLKKADAEVGIKAGYGAEGAVFTLIELEAANRELKRLNEELAKARVELDEKVKERTKELQERVDELEQFHRLTVGRELKMAELKEKIKRLEEELEKTKGRQ